MNSRLLFKTIVSGAIAIGIVSTAFAQTAAPAKTDTLKTAIKSSAVKNTLKPQSTCPVMGEPINKKLFVDYNGQRIYICCKGCIAPIKSDPEKYIKKLEGLGQSVETIAIETKPAVTKAAESGYYTCSMHPEVHQDKPGNCSKCGMKLDFKKVEKDTAKTKSMDHSKMKM